MHEKETIGPIEAAIVVFVSFAAFAALGLLATVYVLS